MERLIREHHANIAGFIIEPLVQGLPILVHPPGYLKRVRELTREYNIPLIADEVAVGFGRTGTFFACEQEGVEPDFLCLAKGDLSRLSSPAATLATDVKSITRFWENPTQAGPSISYTYTGNPLACAAALASLELFDKQNLLSHITQQQSLIAEKLDTLAEHPHVGEIRRRESWPVRLWEVVKGCSPSCHGPHGTSGHPRSLVKRVDHQASG
ncbi:MAG: aminotransferase class III-fold pyridoxal phosphate-dependent enzyme [Planctomycetaceae bacterium]